MTASDLLLVTIIVSVVIPVTTVIGLFFCCKCSPCYRCCNRSDLEGRVITGGQVPAQPMETTATTGHITQVQLPAVVRSNPTLPPDFNEPPPPYTVAYSKGLSVAVTDHEPVLWL